MIRTLHMYIARDLAKVTALALAAFTLMMTVFAVMEPLRKRGLAPAQVISLFAFTLPVMFSLTLPIAALFAATIVYGRFAQENELLACKASGISTMSLLKPALILGAMVTAISLGLSNFVSPQLARMGELAVKANARGILFHELSSQGRYKFENHIIYADSAELVGESIHLKGVTYADISDAVPKTPKAPKPKTGTANKPAASEPATTAPAKPKEETSEVLFVVASAATVSLVPDQGEWYATVELENPTLARTQWSDDPERKIIDDETVGNEVLQRPLDQIPVPSPFKEKASFYDWHKLLDAVENPSEHREIADQLQRFQRAICHDMFACDVIKAVKSTGQYDRLKDKQQSYIIKAATATIPEGLGREAEVKVALAGGAINGKPQPVEVTILQGGKPKQVVTADFGTVSARWTAQSNASMVGIELRDKSGVIVRLPEESADHALRRSGWNSGMIPMPDDINAAGNAVSLAEIYDGPQKFTQNQTILKQWAILKTRTLSKFLGDITGELHSRVAYSVSCFLLVAMGAALGLVYRGGQLVSAFALCVVPATIVIVLMLMGKELASNPGVLEKHGMWMGLSAIWSGIVILAIANVVIYFRLARR